MKKQNIFSMAMCALMATATLTSCEGALDDIFGEWSRPVQKKECPISFSISSKLWGSKDSKFTVEVTKNGDYTVTFSSSDPSIATVDPNTGEVTPVGAGTVDIIAKIVVDNEGIFESTSAKYTLTIEEGYQYSMWNQETGEYKLVVIPEMPNESELETVPPGTPGGIAGYKLLPGGSYIVAEDMTFATRIKLTGTVNIILCDGVTLKLNEWLYCYEIVGTIPSPYYELNIYGQSENSGKLITKQINGASPLNVYGGQIDATNSGNALNAIVGMNVYGGKVNACNTDSNSGSGIMMEDGTTLTIYGGEVTAKGPAAGDHQYDNGISARNGNVVVNGGKLVAISRGSYSSKGIYGNLTVNGGSVEVNSSVDKAVTGTITAGAGVTLQDSNDKSDETSWTTITGTSSTKHYIRTK